MKKKLHRMKKFFVFSIVLLQLIFSNTLYASAQSVSAALQEAEWRYHLNLRSIQNFGEGFNVSADKTTPPQVMINFTPTDPKEGQKVTARAMPMYFDSPKEQLYFTWYIKHEGCEKNNSPSREKREKCDADYDGDIDEEDWKTKAMRIIANGGWDPQLDIDADGENEYDDEGDFYDRIGNSSGYENDHDGFEGPLGGFNKKDMPKHCYVHNFENGKNYEVVGGVDLGRSYYSLSCPTGFRARCVNNVFGNDGVGGYTYKCADSGNEPICRSNFAGNITATCFPGTAKCIPDGDNFNEETPVQCSQSPISDYETPTCVPETVNDSDVGCVHLFPDADGEQTGDDRFNIGEEEFWRTDPQDSDTAEIGNKDEANVAGLGVDSFTWTYQEEDKVGVIVEGTSTIPTKYDDSSAMIMWALPKNDCKVENTFNEYEVIKGYYVAIPHATIDINDCLEDNLVDPRAKEYQQMEVNLAYTPENPINDPSDSVGDNLNVQSTINNLLDGAANIYYEWDLRIGKDMNNFETIDQEDLEKVYAGKLRGTNIPSLSLKMNLPEEEYFSEGIAYLRVKLTVRGYVDGKVREGRTDVVIKVNSSKNQIKSFLAKNSNDGISLTFENEDIICQRNIEREDGTTESNLLYYVCPVLQNQIIGLEVARDDMDNFAWSVNGVSLSCDQEMSTKCSEDQGNVMFFPVLGNVGDIIDVKMKANNMTRDRSIELNRKFQIVEPYIKIVSQDLETFWPRLLGRYENTESEMIDDFSEKSFYTYTDALVSLSAEFHPDYLGRQIENTLGSAVNANIQWKVDGEEFYDENSSDLNFEVEKEEGEFYDINLNAFYQIPEGIKNALSKNWDISKISIQPQYLSDSVQAQVISPDEFDYSEDPDENLINMKKTKKVLASLASNLPGQIGFILRVAVSMLVLIFVAGFSLSFIGDSRVANKKESDYE